MHEVKMKLWNSPLERFVEELSQSGDRRAYILSVGSAGHRSQIKTSHAFLDGLAEVLATEGRDFDAHEGLFFEIGQTSGHLLAAFVHRTVRGQAAGGTRFWSYKDVEALVRDGLRLSRGMGHKNALAGLWWGGGKGIIARQPGVDHRDPQLRQAIFRDYGGFVSSLRGLYITAEDVGTTPEDVAEIFTMTRHATCVPPAVGGSGNPSPLTARGVVRAMGAALARLDLGPLQGKTLAVQGLGNVSSFMIGELLAGGVARIIGTDLDERAVKAVYQRFSADAERLELRQSVADDLSILGTACDVLSPNAIGGILKPATIAEIRAPVVCGAANNQLEDPIRDARLLAERGILYIPDFLANRMGIVNCANEQYGVFEGDPAIEAHLDHSTDHGVYQRTLEVIERAERSGRTPAEEAESLAEELMLEEHPIWGHRGRQIIDHLIAEEWEQAG